MKMKLLLCVFLIVAVGAMSLMAADNTKRPHWYSDRGYTLSDMLIFGIDSSTVSGYQLKRRILPVPIVMASSGEDTVWTQLFTVPTGQTITITEAILSAHIEASGTNDSCWGSILYYQADGSTLDTAVARFAVDGDSLAYDDTTYTMTLVDSVFTAGMIVTWWQENQKGAVTGGEGAAVTMKILIDE
jgi:hypothetical protein